LERGFVLLERFRQLAAPVMDFREAADRGEILWRGAKHERQLLARRIVLVRFDEGASERDARGEVRRVPLQAGAAGVDGVLIAAGAPVLLGERRKRNRRRVRLDPASKFFNPWIVRHTVSRFYRDIRTP